MSHTTTAGIGEGLILVPRVLERARVLQLKGQIDARYEQIAAARKAGGLEAAARIISPPNRFVFTASSVTIGAVFSDAQTQTLLEVISTGPASDWLQSHCGSRMTCNLDQSWVRRQFAPKDYPQFHAPHGWHQDGGLEFDYPAHNDENIPPDALLSMVTCWIPLVPCGLSAPGLELLLQRFETLLPPAQLSDAHVRAQFPSEAFWHPLLEAGDALLFRGDILHRTYATPDMTQSRTSIELRFFPAVNLPPRLGRDRFIHVHA